MDTENLTYNANASCYIFKVYCEKTCRTTLLTVPKWIFLETYLYNALQNGCALELDSSSSENEFVVSDIDVNQSQSQKSKKGMYLCCTTYNSVFEKNAEPVPSDSEFDVDDTTKYCTNNVYSCIHIVLALKGHTILVYADCKHPKLTKNEIKQLLEMYEAEIHFAKTQKTNSILLVNSKDCLTFQNQQGTSISQYYSVF